MASWSGCGRKRRRDEVEEAQPSCFSGGHEEQDRAACLSRFNNGNRKDAHHDSRSDDRDGHYVFELGESITHRYKIISKLGEGTFGQVLECWDRKHREFVAIKVVRNVPKYRDAALLEIEVLRCLGENDRNFTRGCLRLRDWFDYRNHMFIVSEKLGPSLYDFLKWNGYRPFTIQHVRDIGRQILNSVAYLHDLSLIHTDLKPENVLLVSSDYCKVQDKAGSFRIPASSEVRLIDFGSATFENRHHSSIVSTRQYRAPEIILGLGWSFPCDIWSIGCILVELFTGDPLFQTHENIEHLAMMERVLGPLPRQIIRSISKRYEKYFRHKRELFWPEGASSDHSVHAVKSMPKLKGLVEKHVGGGDSDSLTDLLHGLLKYETSERLTAKEALGHPFFREERR